MLLAAIGIVIGIALSLALTRLLRTLLFEVSATDVTTFTVTAALLAGVAMLASYVPARRAARVDPLVALRSD
jgi:putative ABC transport system permease protein